MKLVFRGEQEDKKNFCNQVYFEAVSLCDKGAFEVEFKKLTKSRTLPQNAGYWRICTILAPYVKEQYGEICDKEFVSDMAKLSAGYSHKVGKQIVPKSLTKATQDDMAILIEQLYKICEFFKLKDYELTSSENRAMINYYGVVSEAS